MLYPVTYFLEPEMLILYYSLIFQIDLRNIPEEVVKETLEYKCLQSQFSLLYNESLGVKTQLDEARSLLLTTKNAHLRQIEHMEVIIHGSKLNLMRKKKSFTHQKMLNTDILLQCNLTLTCCCCLCIYCCHSSTDLDMYIITFAWRHIQQNPVFNSSE